MAVEDFQLWGLSGAAMQESIIRPLTGSCAKKCCQQLLIWAQNSPIFSEFCLKMLTSVLDITWVDRRLTSADPSASTRASGGAVAPSEARLGFVVRG
jgi:hypothetical protein